MAASTLLDVIASALGALNEAGFGQTVAAEDGALGLRLSNLLLKKWSAQRLFLSYVATRTYPLTALTASYGLGPTATAPFNVVRPTFIESAQVNVVGSNYWPDLSIIDRPQWDAIRNKGSAADVPDVLYPEYSFPNMSLNFNPAPFGTPNVRLGVWEPLAAFDGVQSPIALSSDAYEEMLESHLVIALAPYYNKSVTKEIADRAADASAAVMKLNAQGLGGSLGESQKLVSPNVGGPMPGGGA